MNRRFFLVALGVALLPGCRQERNRPPATNTPPATATALPPTPSPAPTPTSGPTNPPEPTLTPDAPRLEPYGFPLDPATRTGLVAGQAGAPAIQWGAGPTAFEYSRDDQPSNDADRANRCGWNARVHVEYEGQPAVDWYVPVGTSVLATMDGTATLLINTVANPFDVYGVDREPFLGNPDRSRARPAMFPGPGGGQGVFVRIENERFRTDSAHFDLAATLPFIPADAWLEGWSPDSDFDGVFASLRDFRIATAVARWPVRAGDAIGATGDTGYSEAPHLHYAIRPAGSSAALCPTAEPGFEERGWLFRKPEGIG
ncbi:MAG TPA: M23 family metallopeptidase [Tepidiformaceae bacterium]|nr:M23 family metallopeptidase [Tepidiformaceae bacterium]